MMQIVMRAGGSPEELEALSREGTALAARTEDPHAVALVLHACGFLKAMRGQPDALDALRGAVRAADATEDAGLKAAVRYGQSLGYLFSRKFAQALRVPTKDSRSFARIRSPEQPGSDSARTSPSLSTVPSPSLTWADSTKRREISTMRSTWLGAKVRRRLLDFFAQTAR